MKILLAGPGTGKTSKIKSLVQGSGDGTNVLILSFTNTTVGDLQKKLADTGVTEQNCMTLHKFAVKYNHDKSRHVLLNKEISELQQIAESTTIPFDDLCNFLSCTTFTQMIDRFVSYAKANETYLKEKMASYSILIVDEYQDFNPHEQALIDILIGIITDSYVLGDDDQCIYDFKDASTDKIIAFYNDAGNEKLDHEHKCHRCPDKVVHHASILIKKNTKRVDKTWEKSGKTGELIYKQLTTFADVAQYVGGEVKMIVEAKPNDSVIILSPVQFAVPEVVKKLDELGIKYTNYFTERIPEDMVTDSWKLKMLFGNYKYANLVFLGYKSIQNRRKFYALLKTQFEKGQNFDELLQLFLSRLPEEVKQTHTDIEQALATEELKKFAELYEKAEGQTENEKLENLFRAIEDVVDESIKVMSIHKSKGLDAEHVFMIGLVEGIIPNKKKGSDTLESQRRLFYVGMTRAKDNLHLLSSVKIDGKDARTVNIDDFQFDRRQRQWNGKASVFIQELGL